MNRPMSVSEYLTKTSAPAAAGRMARAWAATRGAAGRAGSHINANRLPYGLAAGALGAAGLGAGLHAADYDTAGNVALGAGGLAALGGAGLGASRGIRALRARKAADALRGRGAELSPLHETFRYERLKPLEIQPERFRPHELRVPPYPRPGIYEPVHGPVRPPHFSRSLS